MGIFEELFGQSPLSLGFSQHLAAIDPFIFYAPPPDIPDYERLSKRKRVESREVSPKESVRNAVQAVKNAQNLLT